MDRVPAQLRSVEVWISFALVEVVALAVRMLVLPLPGHGGDVMVMARWAENLAQVGPWGFYTVDSSVYPALLPFLWPLGLAFDGDTLFLAIKGLSIPFDLVTTGVLFWVVGGRVGPRAGLAAAALFAWNPAPIIAGPIWGQVDGAGTLLFLGALVALANARLALAGGLAILAGLAKPQFGLVALPVAVVAVQEALRRRRWTPILAAAAGASIAAAAVGLVLSLSPFRWFEILRGAGEFQPQTSLNAVNLWGVLIGMEIDDGPYVLIGAVLLVAGLALALVPLRRGHDLATVLAVGLMLAFAFYFLPTRVHERYLFPALAVAAPFAAVHRGSLVAYLVLSAGFALVLVRALVLTTSFSLGTTLNDLVTSQPALWLIALMLFSSAAVLIRLALTGAGDRLNAPGGAASEASAAPA